MLGREYANQDCAIAGALDLLGERWTLLIVRDAFFGVRRFDDFVVHLDIPRAVLSDRLKTLLRHEVLVKAPDLQRPGRFEYRLTEAGEELWPLLYALISWGSRYARRSTRRYTHVGCDAELDQSGRCPGCGELPPAADVMISLRAAQQPGRTDPVSRAMREPHRLLTPLPVE